MVHFKLCKVYQQKVENKWTEQYGLLGRIMAYFGRNTKLCDTCRKFTTFRKCYDCEMTYCIECTEWIDWARCETCNRIYCSDCNDEYPTCNSCGTFRCCSSEIEHWITNDGIIYCSDCHTPDRLFEIESARTQVNESPLRPEPTIIQERTPSITLPTNIQRLDEIANRLQAVFEGFQTEQASQRFQPLETEQASLSPTITVSDIEMETSSSDILGSSNL